MTSDLWSEVKILKSITLHVVCWNIGFLDQGIQIWHHFFIWISWRSQNDLWPLIRGQNFEFKNFAWYMLKFRFFGSRNPKINFFFTLTSWRLPNDLWPQFRSQHFEFTNFAWFILKYWFFGPRRPKMTLFFHFNLIEVIKKNFEFTDFVCMLKYSFGAKESKKHIILFFHLTSELSLNKIEESRILKMAIG